MRIVCFSDIHGNAVALERVLAHIRRETAPDAWVVAGDLVASGPRPAEVVGLLRGLPASATWFVCGNTDRYVLQEQDEASCFTRAQLGQPDLDWLEALPFSHTIAAPRPDHDVLIVHANPRNLYDALKPEHDPVIIRPLLHGTAQRTIVFGHYHVPYIREVDGYTLVDVASVGLPRDGLLRAVYAVLTFDGAAWQVAHHRISFDAERVARDYEAVGFPNARRMARKLLDAHY